MLNIAETSGMVVAADTRATIRAIDQALIEETRLCSSIVEASALASMPMAQSQKLLESMARSFEHLVASRADMLSVVRQLAVIKSRSNLDSIDYGCPDDLTAMVSARQSAPLPHAAPDSIG